jgi:hypothetical protein
MRKSIVHAAGAAVILSTLALAATPADARHRRHWDRHRVDVDATDVIAGVLILGTIAAIADSGERKRRDRRSERYDPPYRPDPRPDTGYDYDRKGGDQPGWDQSGSARTEAGRAADACAWAAEGEAGRDARTTAIDGVRAEGDGWSVDGRVADAGGDTRAFRCTFRAGRVSGISFSA